MVLTHFTLTSGNDTPGRDPVDWQIQGSNDGASFTPIFTTAGTNVWGVNRLQTIRWTGAGADFATPAAYTYIRFETTATSLTGGARFQLDEFEIFGTVVPEPSTSALFGLARLGLILRRRR